jgi:mannose-6-phosphate isomerase-like protein (cupin superfamily)
VTQESVSAGERPQARRAIRADEYRAAFAGDPHVFLVGDLRKPAAHPYWRDPRVELVLCRYEAGQDGEPHWHADVTEYELVLEGRIGYLHVASGETLWFEPGDLSAVPAGSCVKRSVPVASRTLAVKVPSRPGDKVLCHACARRCDHRIAPESRPRSSRAGDAPGADA